MKGERAVATAVSLLEKDTMTSRERLNNVEAAYMILRDVVQGQKKKRKAPKKKQGG